jgi:hypothetical protein
MRRGSFSTARPPPRRAVENDCPLYPPLGAAGAGVSGPFRAKLFAARDAGKNASL